MPKLKTLQPRVATLKQKVAMARAEGGQAGAFYSSPEWRQLRAVTIALRGRICEGFGQPAHAVPRSERIHADHRVEMSDGGAPLDLSNIVLLCIGCHNRKTAAARSKRLTGV